MKQNRNIRKQESTRQEESNKRKKNEQRQEERTKKRRKRTWRRWTSKSFVSTRMAKESHSHRATGPVAPLFLCVTAGCGWWWRVPGHLPVTRCHKLGHGPSVGHIHQVNLQRITPSTIKRHVLTGCLRPNLKRWGHLLPFASLCEALLERRHGALGFENEQVPRTRETAQWQWGDALAPGDSTLMGAAATGAGRSWCNAGALLLKLSMIWRFLGSKKCSSRQIGHDFLDLSD